MSVPDFELWDERFKPEAAGGDLSGLPDGTYDFKIHSVVAKPIKTGGAKMDFTLEVLTPGQQKACMYTAPIWMTSEESYRRSGWVIKQLGFDVDNWTAQKGRPYRTEHVKALRWMPGMHIRGQKTTSVTKATVAGMSDKVWHNLNISGRVLGADGKPTDGIPAVITPEMLNEPDPNAVAVTDEAAGDSQDSNVPF